MSKYYRWLSEHNLCHRSHLDVTCDYLAIFRDYKQRGFALLNEQNDYEAVFDKISTFIYLYMPALRELSLRHCSVVLTLTGLVQVLHLFFNSKNEFIIVIIGDMVDIKFLFSTLACSA